MKINHAIAFVIVAATSGLGAAQAGTLGQAVQPSVQPSNPVAQAQPTYRGTGDGAVRLAQMQPTAVPRDIMGGPAVVGRNVVVVDPYTTRVAPRHVARAQNAARRATVPGGYTGVWTDGRLNPHRAHQTFAGKAATDRMWTETVPRRLILVESRRDVTAQYPGLQYPYLSFAEQRAASAPAAVVSGRSSQPAATMAVQPPAAGQGYVQAGIYADRAQAARAAQRLTGAGLPARLGHLTRSGRTYSLLLSGPFADAQSLNGALTQVRRAGFTNAVLR